MVVLVLLLVILLRCKAILWWEQLRVECWLFQARFIVTDIVCKCSAVNAVQTHTTATGAATAAAWRKVRAHHLAKRCATNVTCPVACCSCILPQPQQAGVLYMLQLLCKVLHAAEPRKCWQSSLHASTTNSFTS
jgi:hypothetical protein